ncbi:glycerophosphodiester phosphodiesterase [Pseudoalteromonas denitrificans]|uniref:Glycerophosphoryl diester phosphodiesterase n=1 Tax=Pseudoalteromonas denitrificans DSM 6059 TaxID=1123010 RepID=A0A1I1JAL2_9GAMM|nr:glycerophosphodiester phosphodiesterase family protein [Pseudoalteromonas denitrificans]SFC45496.1 glycerophosphoryl diester phosphodiesterase [Pseudoalteromonas denitrificans DSM 6059]
MKIFAHRGASGNFPENTHSAINGALDVEVDGIEVDLQSAKDDYVIIHDSWLDRTTNGQGKVSDYFLSQLKEFDAGNGEKIPNLQDLFNWVGTKAIINIELKHTTCLKQLKLNLEKNLAQGNISKQKMIISSYDHHQLKWIKQQLPWLRIGALTSSIPINYAQFAQELNAFSIHIDMNFINNEFVLDAKKRGLKVYCYTVDKYEDIKRMHTLKVDGIFTNYPANTKNILQQLNL